ncbi:hypothetical protein BSPWISOXPB_4633 [uncultured Gammaproteobacteria bacterium]|nr:hypothetical protein BSPWISOXPB_4633 [uncultured Gammaproteobacteria bacterium]
MLKRLKTATLIRHFRPVKKRAKAKKALTRLRTIANKLIRELQRKLPQYLLFEIIKSTSCLSACACSKTQR